MAAWRGSLARKGIVGRAASRSPLISARDERVGGTQRRGLCGRVANLRESDSRVATAHRSS